ncbi:uncharacterized protein LOC134824281 isoform X2 [Bolinopsis microptera]|uniref:uncharacterized protein LOC134824281 isoform X2 n=1 Tax=Bolinopsis microptera TaxID=2820187 RepID=UPI003078F12D
MVSKQSVNYEHKFELQSELERLPSHFNHKIEKDQNRLAYVHNEILFKMETLPAFFKPVLINLIGFIECAKGNGKKGAQCFRNVTKLDEKNVVCLSNKAYLALKINNYTEVERIISDIYRICKTTNQSSSSQIHAEMGHFYQWFGLNCAAAREYKECLNLDPDNLIGCYGLAVVLYDMSKHEGRISGFKYLNRSLDLFKKVLSKCEDFTMARIYHAKAKNQLILIVLPESNGDEEADRIFTQVMETDCAPDILCMIGEEYLKLGILEGEPSAISIFERALQKKPNSKVYHLLALAMRATFFKANPDMHEVYKQGLFAKTQSTIIQEEAKKPDIKEKGRGAKKTTKPPKEAVELDQQNTLTEEQAASERPKEPPRLVTLEQVIDILSTAVKLSRGANREAVFDLAETLWLSGERMKAVTNFELATRSENSAIQNKAHIRLAHAFLDTGELTLTEYHLRSIMKLDGNQKGTKNKSDFNRLLHDLAIAFLRKHKDKNAAYWVGVSIKYETEYADGLRQHMVFTRSVD